MTINTSSYDVIISRDLLGSAGEISRQKLGLSRAVIVSDDNVYPLYGETVKKSLVSSGFDVRREFIFPHGEENKNLSTLGEILEHLAKESLTRTDVVFALGGGVVGDTAGFAAAVYLRGIRFVQIPTTVLASVDSSVGGKTAVDLTLGKNLVGAFHEPSLVLCDPDTFSTLSDDYVSDGIAEIIKTGFIRDRELLTLLESGFSGNEEEIIARSVKNKNDVVSEDLYDNGQRQLLNFGHTVGHAVEALSGYKIHHGHAVASGMYFIAKYASDAGICSSDVLPTLSRLLEKYSLPSDLTSDYGEEDIFKMITHDKKTRGSTITVVFPESVGKCILKKLSLDEMRELIKVKK